MNLRIYKYFIWLLLSFIFTAAPDLEDGVGHNFSAGHNGLSRIGDYGYPNNQMNDRAKVFSIKGKTRSALLNFGAYIDGDYNPSGAWGNYAYLPSVAFMAGVPGYMPSSDFSWEYCNNTNILCESLEDGVSAWVSTDAYDAWNESLNNLGQPNRFSGIVYNLDRDRGDLALKRNSTEDLGTPRFKCNLDGYTNEDDCELNGGEWVYNGPGGEFPD